MRRFAHEPGKVVFFRDVVDAGRLGFVKHVQFSAILFPLVIAKRDLGLVVAEVLDEHHIS